MTRTLKQLSIGESAVVTSVGGEGALRQHFLDMGLIPGTEVTVIKYAPMGDPMEIRLHGYELTLRLAEADRIEIEPLKAVSSEEEAKKHKKGSEYHDLQRNRKQTVRRFPDPQDV